MSESKHQVAGDPVLRKSADQDHAEPCASNVADPPNSSPVEGEATAAPTLDEAGHEINHKLADWHRLRSRHPALVMCRR